MGCLDFWLTPGQRSASEEIKIPRWGQGSSVRHLLVSDTPWTLRPPGTCPASCHLGTCSQPHPSPSPGQRLVCKQSRRVQELRPLWTPYQAVRSPAHCSPRPGFEGTAPTVPSTGTVQPHPQVSARRPFWTVSTTRWQGSCRLTPHLEPGQWSEKGPPKSSQSGWSKVWEWPPALFPIPQVG